MRRNLLGAAAIGVIRARTTRSSLAWVNANGKPPRAYHDLNAAGIRAWREWADRLGGDWFRQTGSLHWADPADAAQVARLAEHVAMLAAWDYPARFITSVDSLRLEPDLAIPRDVREVAYFPDEAYLLTVPAIQLLLGYATARRHPHNRRRRNRATVGR